MIYAPWTNDQVSLLEARQDDETKHSYTCVQHGEISLVPTCFGFVYPEWQCNYIQNWCHDFDLSEE